MNTSLLAQLIVVLLFGIVVFLIGLFSWIYRNLYKESYFDSLTELDDYKYMAFGAIIMSAPIYGWYKAKKEEESKKK